MKSIPLAAEFIYPTPYAECTGLIIRSTAVTGLNGADRLLYGVPRYLHITPLLRDKLRWLKCWEIVQFELCIYESAI